MTIALIVEALFFALGLLLALDTGGVTRWLEGRAEVYSWYGTAGAWRWSGFAISALAVLCAGLTIWTVKQQPVRGVGVALVIVGLASSLGIILYGNISLSRWRG